jgi:hypothetical protein
MIRIPTKLELEELRAFKKPLCLTIYSPYIASNAPDNNPNRIQLKNLLKEAHKLLSDHGLTKREIDSMIQPVEKLADGDRFRTNYPHGLAFKYYDLPPKGFTPYVFVNKSFKLKPILDLASNNLKYYLLIVSYNGAHLLKGDLYQIKKLKFHKAPAAMLKELNIDELPHERQFHNVAPASQGKKSERSHGQYNDTEVNKDMLARFFRIIDEKVTDQLKGKDTPLIIAGVDYLLPLYRQVNTYPHLLTSEITGNLEHLSLESIHKKVYKLIGSQ